MILDYKPLFAMSFLASLATLSQAQSTDDVSPQWNAHWQSTVITQYKNDFYSPYTGAKSMLNTSQGDIVKSYTGTITGFFTAKLWSGAEVVYNPEAFQGIPFSELSGLGGFPNGELQKGAEVPAIYYNARSFIRQTWELGGADVHVPDGPNQLAHTTSSRRLTMTYGALSTMDYFDLNAYSHDPRVQFQNWSIMASGAYDYAANARGYTQGLVVEYFHDDWTLRAARLAMPITPNVFQLDPNLSAQHGDQIEVTHAHWLGGTQPGHIRVLAFDNKGFMASYQNAIQYGLETQQTPSIFDVRQPGQHKRGYALNIDQALSSEVGLFARYSHNDGKTETQAFTDINTSLSGGVVFEGSLWGSGADRVGFGGAQNQLSQEAIQYLQLGGVTMFIGDGRLNYRPEQILEAYYNRNLTHDIQLTADVQLINNPGYNADRGPVYFYGLRLHAEY